MKIAITKSNTKKGSDVKTIKNFQNVALTKKQQQAVKGGTIGHEDFLEG